MAYDSPNSTVRREFCSPIAAAGATTESNKFRSFQAMRLKKVHATVVVAGTATTHGYNVFKGTTSVGAIALSTSTAGVSASSGALNVDFPTMEQLSVKSLADATGSAQIVYEYEVSHDAAPS